MTIIPPKSTTRIILTAGIILTATKECVSEIVVSTELCFKIPHLLIWSMGSLLSDLEPSPPLDSPASSTEETTFSASASELRLASSRMAASLTADAEADAGAGRTAFTGGRM